MTLAHGGFEYLVETGENEHGQPVFRFFKRQEGTEKWIFRYEEIVTEW